MGEHGKAWIGVRKFIVDGVAARSDREALRLSRALTDAIARRDRDEAGRLMRELGVRLAASESARASSHGDSSLTFAAAPTVVAVAQRSMPLRGAIRRSIIAALAEIAVAARARLIADYAAARFGEVFEPKVFAGLRRDEQRAWENNAARPTTFMVPALEGRSFQPVRGVFALADWPLERRVLGPWSERADHLTATRQLARQLAWLNERDPEAAMRLGALVHSMARSIPGAVETDAVDTERVAKAAEAELHAFNERDQSWRKEAADRGRAQLDRGQQLWGKRS